MLAAAIALAEFAARADQIYGLNTDGPWQQGTGNNWLAQTFSTGGIRMTLDSVSPLIRNDSGVAGTLNLWLYATDGDRKRPVRRC
jgi:hypothetical protein